jgi:molybdopterin biosynthesis enzyme
VRRHGSQAEPLASKYWPLSVIARADGYIVISPDSEGASAGSAVRVWPFI